MKKKVLLIPLGGTIAAKVADRKSPIYLSGHAGIAATLAGLKDLEPLIDFEVEPLIENGQAISCHSSSLTQSTLIGLSRQIIEGVSRPDVDGVIVTQGTDTLEETAFFLQLTLKTSKPVIVTGAMRPLEYGSPDGPDNLRCAAKCILAASDRNLGVLVAFQFQIFSAFNVAKILSYPPTVSLSSEKLPCPFHSPAFGPIGRVTKAGTGIDHWKIDWNLAGRFFEELPGLQRLKFDVVPGVELPTVPILPQYIGHDSIDLIENWYMKKNPKVSCFILEGNGNGSISDRLKGTVLDLSKDHDLSFVRSSRVPTTWCLDDQTNYPGTIGARILTSVQARIFAQLVLKSKPRQISTAMAQAFATLIPQPMFN